MCPSLLLYLPLSVRDLKMATKKKRLREIGNISNFFIKKRIVNESIDNADDGSEGAGAGAATSTTETIRSSGSTSTSSTDSQAPPTQSEAAASGSSISFDTSESIENSELQDKKKVVCKYQPHWENTHKWLYYTDPIGMLCRLCVKTNKKNPFTSGCTNYRTSTLTRHADSADHQKSLRDSIGQDTFKVAAAKSVVKFAEKEQAAKAALRTAYYTATENIPISKYTSLLELQGLNGCELENLNCGENANYKSRGAAEEFLDSCVEVIEDDIQNQIQASEFISIMTDESTDIVVKKKAVVYCIVVDDELQRKILFLGNLEIDEVSVTAEVLFKHLKAFLESKNINISTIIGFGSDGANIMTGRKNGVGVRFGNLSPHMIAIHCMAHRLNLCSVKAADSEPFMKSVFQEFLTDLYYYFSKSTARTVELSQIQAVLDSPQVTIKEVHQIRWMACYNSISAVFQSWVPLINYFKKHRKDSDRCEKLYGTITNYIFVRVMYLMMDIIPSLAALNMVFQKQELDIAAVQPAIDGFFSAADKALESKSYYQHDFRTNIKKDSEKKTVSLKNIELGLQYDGKDLKVADLDKKFSEIRKTFVEKLKSEMSRRFPTENTSVATSFSVLGLRSLSYLSEEDQQSYGIDGLNTLLNHFGVPKSTTGISPVTSESLVDKNATIAEYNLAKRVILDQRYPRDNTFTLWRIMKTHHSDQFPNLIKLAKIAMHMPLNTADCERGFSVQNNIHTAIRNKLTSESVNKLMLIQLEGGPINQFPFEKALKKWKEKKERRLFLTK